MEKVKVDEVECQKEELVDLINRYHGLGYFIEVNIKDMSESDYGFMRVKYSLSIYKIEKGTEDEL